jgi:hypothetical protein
MERKVGEIFDFDENTKLEVVKVNNLDCDGCICVNGEIDCSDDQLGMCVYSQRTDHHNVIFKKVENDQS